MAEGQGRNRVEASDICIKERGVTPDFHFVRLFQVLNPSAFGGGSSSTPLPAFSFQVLYFTGLFSCLVIGISWTWVIH